MLSPRHGMIEPYPLASGPHLFSDWRYVRPGMVRWDSADGLPTALYAAQGDPGPVVAQRLDAPYNLSIAARKPLLTGPFIKPEAPWERIIFWHSLLYDGGKYRVWYTSVPDDYWKKVASPLGTKLNADWGHLLCYAESDDLVHWSYPELNMLEYHGRATNIVFGGPLTPETGYHGGGVFIDPTAPPAERYKTMYMGRLSLDRLRECEARLGLTADTMAVHYQSAMFGAVSPDGFHWTALPDPIMLANSDTNNRICYDSAAKKYVAYVRMWLYGRRAVGRAETEDFRRWPLPEPVLWIGGEHSAAVDIYTNAATLYPSSTDQYFMFPAFYQRDVDTTEIQMAASQEGRLWSFVPGGAVIPTGLSGEWHGGCVFAAGDLVPFSPAQVALPVVGYVVPHKYPRFMPLGQIGFAVWPAERLAAIESAGPGGFTTPQVIFQGGRLRLNVETQRAGGVQVEIAAAEGAPKPVPQAEGEAIPGFSFADCDSASGNLPDHTVSWRGQADLSFLAGQPVSLRFRLQAAKIYAFQFV